ncbi:MAG: SAF domain-containing protein [Gammaproteobacteria bacterium]|nr:SAF domain-containing protein [Gammaproteobacteria bacterium]
MYQALQERAAAGKPIRVALIGAGKFATMYLHQARRTPGVHVCAVCDLDEQRARDALTLAGWDAKQLLANDLSAAVSNGATWITDDARSVIHEPVDVAIEATGDPLVGVEHALACFEQGVHVVMVNVEADALVGPYLARAAHSAGVVYTLAYGDQPALIAELVDWARVCGFQIVCAGKGTKYLPRYHQSTPDTVWDFYGLTAAEAQRGGMNSTMFNSFLDGTKSAIEMAAVANACELSPAESGLQFPPCSTDELPRLLKPRSEGGLLDAAGTVEVISSLTRDGAELNNDLRWGVYVTFAGDSDYAQRCFREYGLVTDAEGRYSALYRPSHLIGLELGMSVASAVLRNEAIGTARCFNADVVAVAKRPLVAGEVLDGEGGYTVWGRLQPAALSLQHGALPLGLCRGAKLRRAIAEGEVVQRADVIAEESSRAWRVRGDMEADSGYSSVVSHK